MHSTPTCQCKQPISPYCTHSNPYPFPRRLPSSGFNNPPYSRPSQILTLSTVSIFKLSNLNRPSRPEGWGRDTLRHAVSRCNVYDMGHFLPVFVDTPLHSRRPKELVGYASKAFASELSLLSQGS